MSLVADPEAPADSVGGIEALVLRGLMSISTEALIVTDAQMRVLMFSSGAEQIFGYTGDEVVGRQLGMLLPERFRSAHSARVAVFSQSEVGSRLMNERTEIYGRRKSGDEFAVEASISKLATPDGLIFTAILRDISERRRQEASVLRAEQRLRLAIANAGLHVFELDYRSRTLVKAGAEDTFFDSPLTYEALTRDIWAPVHPMDREAAKRAWAASQQSGHLFEAEFRTARRDDREVWALFTSELVSDSAGRPERLIGALQDITPRKRAEVEMQAAMTGAEAANTAKSTFLATMSHEIRTPLNGILGMVQAMGLADLAPEQRNRLDIINSSGRALLTILNDLLDLAKVEAGKLELEEVAFDAAELIAGVVATFSDIAEGKGLNLSLCVHGEDRWRMGDPTRLRQIVSNLVSNALKFTERGSVVLALDCSSEGIVLDVTDTGPGIAPDVLPNLFSSFVQADASTTRKFGGTGLGLAICRRLAALMDGEIEARSTLGEGSSFRVRLALQRTEAPNPTVRGLTPASTSTSHARGHAVLAAEDNLTNQLVLKTLLQHVGIEPDFVETGAEAIDAWAKGNYDLILMDVQMPIMDGVSATRQIRKLEADGARARIPILALTANAQSHQAEAYIAAGMDGCITKPIDASELFSAIEFALRSEA